MNNNDVIPQVGSNVNVTVNGMTINGTITAVDEKAYAESINNSNIAKSSDSCETSKIESSSYVPEDASQQKPKEYPHHVVAVRKNEEGNLIAFKLEDGTELNFDDCWQAIHDGQLHLIATKGKDGAPVIRSYGDGDRENNLSNLPIF